MVAVKGDRKAQTSARRFCASDSAGGINGSTFAYNNTNPVVGNTTGFDPADNKFYERALHAENTSSLYQPVSLAGQPGGGYDSMNRLLQYQRGTLDSTGGYLGDGGGSVTSPITLPKTNQSEDWNLDGLGNWRAFTVRAAQACSAISYRRNHNRLNQITQQSYGPYVTPFQYDGKPGASNGNLINDGTLEYQFDGLNRLIFVTRLSDGKPIVSYRYDALNRRTNKTITNGGLSGNIPDSSTDYFYNDSWQCMEERVAGTATAARQYVWGNYIDECIQLTTFSVLGPQNLPAGVYYPLQDLLYRTVALTNSTGGIVEAYDTDAYGNTIILTAADSGGNWFSAGTTQSAYGANEIIFCGYRYDPETQAYYVRNRTYSPWLGRWLQRDPIGYGDGENLYGYAGSGPVRVLDGSGLRTCEAVKGYMHWLDQDWILVAIVPAPGGAGAHAVRVAYPRGVYTRRYVTLFKCCDRGRVRALWGRTAVAAGRITDTNDADAAPALIVKIGLAVPLPYGKALPLPGLVLWRVWNGGPPIRTGLASSLPNGAPLHNILWTRYEREIPKGYRLVNHITCDCPPYKWPPAGGIPKPGKQRPVGPPAQPFMPGITPMPGINH